MKARIKDKKEVAEKTLRIAFDLMGEKIDFKAGQFIYVTIPNPPYIDEGGNRRHFTISSPPEDQDIAITTRIRPTAFKKSLVEIPIGYEVELGPIEGEFVLPEDIKRPLVFLAGGIGITPYISMLAHIRSRQLLYQMTLIYSNKNRQSTPYLDKLEAWSSEMSNLKLIVTLTEDPAWPGEKRRVDTQFIKEYLPESNIYTYFVSGPPDFVEGMGKVLEEVGVERANMELERFTGY